uniref:Uncharacterized protein n=1 Tax=Panagrolaimus sp. ES5 TaxID=591445 RepID=A0AC34G0X5_9BILA
MKSVVIFLAIIYCCSFAIAASSSGEKDDEKTSAESSGQIRLCTCEEMDSCWKQMHEDMKPCTEKCKEKLTAPGLDSDEAKKCFEHKHDGKSSCHKEMQAKMCAKDDHTFVARNETWQGKKTLKKDVENSIEDDQSQHSKKLSGGWKHHHGHHRGHGFFAFVRKNFGESGKDFVKCMRSCFRQKKNKGCMKTLGCGVKKIDRKEFHHMRGECADKREEKKEALCKCLTDAGMKNVICEFGSSKKNSTTTEATSTEKN